MVGQSEMGWKEAPCLCWKGVSQGQSQYVAGIRGPFVGGGWPSPTAGGWEMVPVQDEVVAPDGLWLSVRIWLLVVLGQN